MIKATLDRALLEAFERELEQGVPTSRIYDDRANIPDLVADAAIGMTHPLEDENRALLAALKQARAWIFHCGSVDGHWPSVLEHIDAALAAKGEATK